MKRKQRIDEILSKKLEDFSLEIVDNSNLHKGHNNFTGNDETHIKITLTKKNKLPTDRLNIHRLINELLEKKLS